MAAGRGTLFTGYSIAFGEWWGNGGPECPQRQLGGAANLRRKSALASLHLSFLRVFTCIFWAAPLGLAPAAGPAASWCGWAVAPRPPRRLCGSLGRPRASASRSFIACCKTGRATSGWAPPRAWCATTAAASLTLTTRNGLADNFVTGLWQDPASGALWVAHAQGGRSVRLVEGEAFRPAPATLRGGPAPGRQGAPAPDTARLGAYQRRYPPRPARRRSAHLPARRPRRQCLGWHRRPGPLAARRPLPQPVAPGQRAPAPGHRPNAGPAGTCPGRRPVGRYSGWRAPVACAPGQAAQPVPGLPASLGSAVTALAYAPGSGLWVGTVADGLYLVSA